MTVYVDNMYQLPMGQFGRMKMSHMIADTEAELHVMADKIGVQRRWFQKKPSGDHYDIAMSKRALAVAAGAKEITIQQCCAICHCLKHGLDYAHEPERALMLHRSWMKELAARPAVGESCT
jgi:ABC-type polysaccharide/polyol phosphate transport system ATPase subunit